jgi:hypothetical protein
MHENQDFLTMHGEPLRSPVLGGAFAFKNNWLFLK